MPVIHPNPFDSKYPFELMLAESRAPFRKRLLTRIYDYLNEVSPEGFQDEEGFHFGPAPRTDS